MNIKTNCKASLILGFICLTFSFLLVIFFLTNNTKNSSKIIIPRQEIVKTINHLEYLQEQRNDMLEQVKKSLEKDNIHVEIADNGEVLRLLNSTLSFESNQSEISKDQSIQQNLTKIAQEIHKALLYNDRQKYFNTIFIEGHTDSQNTTMINGNWGLSSFRAISLWNFFDSIDLKPKFSEFKNSLDQNLFSISGYAQTRKIIQNDNTDAKREKNRRIDIRFTLHTPTSKELEKLISYNY